MRDRIRQLAAGQVVVIQPELEFTPEGFDETLEPGTVCSREIVVKSKNGVPFKAFFSSTDPGVRVCTRQAAGLRAVVVLEIDTRRGYSGKDCRINAELIAVTQAGEKHLPCSFTIPSASAEGKIPQTLDELEAFTREEPEQAARLFGTREFEAGSLICRDGRLQGLRRGLLYGCPEQQALENFLVECGKKEPLRISLEKEEVKTQIQETYTEGEICLLLEGSGLLRGTIVSDSEWLCPRRLRLTQKDFEKGKAYIPYTLDALRMHGGNNFGRITITVGNTVLKYEVTALRRRVPKRHSAREASAEVCAAVQERVCRLLLAAKEDPATLLTKGCTMRDEAAGLLTLLEESLQLSPGDIHLRLLSAWCYICLEKGVEARKTLEWCAREISRNPERREVESVFLQVLAGNLMKDEKLTAEAKHLSSRFSLSQGSLMGGLLRLYLAQNCSPEEEIVLLDELERRFPASALLRILAAKRLQKTPKAMTEADDFLLRVLLLLQREKSLSAALIERFLSFDLDGITSKKLLKRLLSGIYEVTADRRALSGICSDIIRGGASEEKDLSWLKEGVDRELSLNGLYDAFITAAAEFSYDGRLPESLLYFYSYKNTLPREARLYLYTYLTGNYAPGSDLYKAYEEQMGKFAMRTLLEGRLEPGLIGLYDKILIPEFVDEHIARLVPDLINTWRITVRDDHAVRAVIHYPELTTEYKAELLHGSVCIPLYTDTAAILFENADGIRYCAKYTKERLMDRPALLEHCRKICPDQLLPRLMDMQKLYQEEIDKQQLEEEARWLCQQSDVSASCKRLLEERILSWCSRMLTVEKAFSSRENTGKDRELDHYLATLSIKDRPDGQLKQLVVQNCLRGNYRAAGSALRLTGTEDIPLPVLEKLAREGISGQKEGYSEEVYNLCCSLNATKDPVILSYLCRYGEGSANWLGSLYDRAAQAGAETGDLAARWLAQALFSGQTDSLDRALSAYLAGGGRDEELLIACLCRKAHDCVMENRIPDEETGEGIETAFREGNESEVLKLALLLYYSGQSMLEAQQKKNCEKLVYGFCMEDRYHPCFHRLSRHIELPHQMEGRIIISCAAEPGRKVFAEFEPTKAVFGRAGADSRFAESRRLMTEIYPGIYTLPVFLFPDEEVRAVIRSGKTVVREPFTVNAASGYCRRDSIYDNLKKLIELAESGSDEEWMAACERYLRMERTTADLFPLAAEADA